MKTLRAVLVLVSLALGVRAAEPPIVRTTGSGDWSAASTWEGGHPPAAGEKVLIRPGHVVT